MLNSEIRGFFQQFFAGINENFILGDITSFLKLVRIVLETSNLAHKYTCVVSENMPFSTKVFLILLMSAFLQKISVFGINSTLTQSNSARDVLEIF